ncbi:hypothetical protein SLH46_00555 [Draconibacterium sp. IB214405]|uniref:hypothetical protein n=1 Tax=Draconibacterium sp. IB214405 TaxID=3097352 RepID=UPI002A0DB0D8|nr:hypothetical protein [Draconibacterium sp. IB214405]MDX8337650.1 hypothetical protein [Draconibacterium sp. IB214405]
MKANNFFLPSLLMLAFVSCSDSSDDNELEMPERSYTKLIERNSDNTFEAELITKAESYYPSRQEVIDAAEWSGMEVPETAYWYYNSFDGVPIPYCITIDAIDYYSDLIDMYNANREDVFFYTAEFTYSANVAFHDNYTSPDKNSMGEAVEPQSFESVYVVTLDLYWTDYCGSLCAMWIEKQRIVVFNESGDLLEVFMDGEISVPVS